MSTLSRGAWPEPVERVAAFLRETGAEARIEQMLAETPTAEAAADAVGCTLGQIVKSLVLLCDGRPVVALVPGDRRADTGRIARLEGVKRCSVAKPDEVLELTGFVPGAVAPFPLPRIGSVLVERRLLRFPVVWAGGGATNHLIALAPLELLRLTRGRVEAFALE